MLRLQNALTFVAFAAVWLASSGLGEKKVTVSEFPGTDLSDLDGNDVGPSYGGLPGRYKIN